MLGKVKQLLKNSPVYSLYQQIVWKPIRMIRKAKKKKYHRQKERAILEQSRKYNIKLLIETGTYKGEMVETMVNEFENIISIELGLDLYKLAKSKFKEFPHVRLFNGDSAEVLEKMLPSINEPAVFWLDAHYSGGVTARGKIDTPIEKELSIILKRKYEDVLIIDDARHFTGENNYPTVEQVKKLVNLTKPKSKIYVHKDMIHILPTA